MILSRNPQVANRLFILATFLIVLWVYTRFEDPIQFAFIGGGIIVSSYFLKRAVHQITGE